MLIYGLGCEIVSEEVRKCLAKACDQLTENHFVFAGLCHNHQVEVLIDCGQQEAVLQQKHLRF